MGPLALSLERETACLPSTFKGQRGLPRVLVMVTAAMLTLSATGGGR